MKNSSGYTNLPAPVITTPVPDTYLLDNQDLLQRMPIALGTLQRWRKAGVLPYYKVGGKIFYRESDLSELLRKNRKPVIKQTIKSN